MSFSKRALNLSAVALLVFLFPHVAHAVITFTQLDDDIFVVSHRVKGIGSRGKAMTLVYEKAASLCVAAGYTHMKILGQESEAAQEDESANASIRVQFYLGDGEGRVACEGRASPQYVEQATKKLAEMGYQRPDMPSAPAEPDVKREASSLGSCTLEQVAAMARTGLSDEQIRAACAKASDR